MHGTTLLDPHPVEFGYSKANWPKVLADLSADIVFAYTYMLAKHAVIDFLTLVSYKTFVFLDSNIYLLNPPAAQPDI